MHGDSEYYINNFSTSGVGIHHENEEGKLRFKVLQEYLEKKVDIDHRFVGYNDESFLSDDFYYREKIYEFPYSETSTINLKIDTENSFDEDPIKVYHIVLGDLGYVPIKNKNKVREIIDKHKIVMIQMDVTGGRYKYVDFENHEIRSGETSLGINITIYYEERV